MKTRMKFIASIKIWVVIYPSITLFHYFLGSSLSGLPLYQRTLVLTVVLVPSMVFIGLPLMEKLLAKVFKRKDNQVV